MQEKIWEDFNSLPAAAQQQVADFVAFLRQRYRQPAAIRRSPTHWEEEPFVGMWESRDDLEDSTEWVRRVREQQWTDSRG